MREQSNLIFKAVDTEDARGRSIRKAMAEIVIILVFFVYLFFNMAFSFVMCVAFRCRLTTSLYRSRCPPRRRFPLANFPLNTAFGNLLSFIRMICPVRRNFEAVKVASMLARLKTSTV